MREGDWNPAENKPAAKQTEAGVGRDFSRRVSRKEPVKTHSGPANSGKPVRARLGPANSGKPVRSQSRRVNRKKPMRSLSRGVNGQNKPRDKPDDYSVYSFSNGEKAKYLAMYALLDACVSYLFFYSVPAFLLLLPGAALFFHEQRKELRKRRKKEISLQFLDGIQLMLAALQAGYSPENAISEAGEELQKIYPPDAVIVREFGWIDAQIRMSRPLEDLILDFGRRTDIPDIVSFGEVFQTAKRTGGDLTAIIRNTVSCIRQKQETLQEIETCLAGKVMEQNIMSAIPILILAYVKLSSPGFLSVMYETTAGLAVMVICFGVYVLAFFWGQRIVRIEV